MFFDRYVDRLLARIVEKVSVERTLSGKKDDSVVRTFTGLNGILRGYTPLVVPVTEESALKVPVFFAGVSVLAQSIAMLPLITYRKTTGDQREKAEDTPEYALLKDAVNIRMTSYEWRFATIVKLILNGNAFTELFWNIDRTKVLAMRHIDHTSHTILGVNTIEITDKNGTPKLYNRDDVLHLKWFTQDGTEGEGVLEHCTEALGFLIAAERYGISFFANGALPFILLTHPGELGQTARENIIESWKKKHENMGHEPAVLEEGMDVKILEVKNNEAQFLELRSFQLQEIARFLRITPHKLQDLERATFSNVVELNQAFVVDSLMPITTNIQQRIKLDIFRFRPELFSEFKFDDLLRGSTKERYETYRVAIQNRLLTPDEIRHIENRNDLTDEQIERMELILKGTNTGGVPNNTEPDTPVGREAAGIKEMQDLIRELAAQRQLVDERKKIISLVKDNEGKLIGAHITYKEGEGK